MHVWLGELLHLMNLLKACMNSITKQALVHKEIVSNMFELNLLGVFSLRWIDFWELLIHVQNVKIRRSRNLWRKRRIEEWIINETNRGWKCIQRKWVQKTVLALMRYEMVRSNKQTGYWPWLWINLVLLLGVHHDYNSYV